MIRKAILYKLFGLGSIPKKLHPLLENEGVVLAEEGMSGWFIAKNVKGPGKIYKRRIEGFSGFLVITNKRVLCYTYWKRQINIAVDDPKISHISTGIPKENILSISFDASVFREEWSGVIEFRFKTDKAREFNSTLRNLGFKDNAQSLDGSV